MARKLIQDPVELVRLLYLRRISLGDYRFHHRLVERDSPSTLLHVFSQSLLLHVVHHHVHSAVLFEEVLHRDDVGVFIEAIVLPFPEDGTGTKAVPVAFACGVVAADRAGCLPSRPGEAGGAESGWCEEIIHGSTSCIVRSSSVLHEKVSAAAG